MIAIYGLAPAATGLPAGHIGLEPGAYAVGNAQIRNAALVNQWRYLTTVATAAQANQWIAGNTARYPGWQFQQRSA
jgi:hypothetical protein